MPPYEAHCSLKGQKVWNRSLLCLPLFFHPTSPQLSAWFCRRCFQHLGVLPGWRLCRHQEVPSTCRTFSDSSLSKQGPCSRLHFKTSDDNGVGRETSLDFCSAAQPDSLRLWGTCSESAFLLFYQDPAWAILFETASIVR